MKSTMWAPIALAAALAGAGDSARLPASDVRQGARDTTLNGELNGTVSDSQGAALADVEITLNGLSIKLGKSAKTDARGQFRIPKLATNEFYRIILRKPGFQVLTQDVTIHATNRKTLTIVMARGDQLAQDSGKYGTISGKIIPFEAPAFYSALVTLLDSLGKPVESVITWDDGKYQIDRIPPGGPYSLLATSMGYREGVVDSIRIQGGERLTFNPMLVWTGSLQPSDRVPGLRGWAWYWPKQVLRRYPRETAADIYTQLTFRFRPRWESRCPVAEKFYVNGQRIAQVPGAVLGKIDFKDVEEFRYIECYDDNYPHSQRNSYWFRVKPSALSKQKKEGSL